MPRNWAAQTASFRSAIQQRFHTFLSTPYPAIKFNAVKLQVRLKAKELEVPLLKVFQDGGELVGPNLLALEKFTSGPQPEDNEHQASLWRLKRHHVEGVYAIRGLLRKYEGEFRHFVPEQWGGDPREDGTEVWKRGLKIS